MRCKFVISVCAATALLSACSSFAPKESVVGDYLSGRLAARTNNVDAAASEFSQAQTGAPETSEVLRDAFFFKLASGDFEQAFPLAERLASNEELGDDGLARVVLAARALKTRDYEYAQEIVSDGVEATFLRATNHILIAWAMAGDEGPNAAYQYLLRAGDENMRGFFPLHLAFFAEQAGRKDEAHSAFYLSIRTLGGPVGNAAFGAFLERSGDEEAAREFYAFLVNQPGHLRKVAQQGVARLDAGEKNAQFEKLSPATGAAIAFYSLGVAILEQAVNQRASAIREGRVVGEINYNLPLVLTQMALYLDPSLDDAIQFGGQIMNFYGDNERAIEMLSRISPSSPHYEQAQIDIASGFLALEDQRRAISVLRTMIKRDLSMWEARAALANVYSIDGQHGKAVKELDALIEILPEEPHQDAWRFFVSRAASLIELDAWERAEKDLVRAVEIAPEQPTALNYLGYSWAERGLNLEEAFALIEKAIALRPDSGAIIDSLGWAHYQLGDYDQAVGHLEHAASLEPGDPIITDHLGDVYWKLGRRIEARYQWERVLELNPDEDLKTSVLRKIDEGLSETGSDSQS